MFRISHLYLNPKHNFFSPVQAMGFARTFNRAQKASDEMKTDLSAYEYKPEHIVRIHPGTQFPDMNTFYGEKANRDKKHTFDRRRTAKITRH